MLSRTLDRIDRKLDAYMERTGGPKPSEEFEARVNALQALAGSGGESTGGSPFGDQAESGGRNGDASNFI
jgi:hypothetical protein